MFAITAFYAGVLAIFYVWLSFWVIWGRQETRVSYGDGDNDVMRKRIRVHANMAEYAPLGLILLALLDGQEANGIFLHLMGLMLTAGRFLHAYGFGTTPQVIKARQAGMILTFSMLLIAGAANILYAIF